MVAYSFKQRFVNQIRLGLGQPVAEAAKVLPPKRQTIRANGKRRHARPGEHLQLYQGMRTRDCFLIGRSICTEAVPITMQIFEERTYLRIVIDGCQLLTGTKAIFVRDDGFDDEADMWKFWREAHPDVTTFHGTLIRWQPETIPAHLATGREDVAGKTETE